MNLIHLPTLDGTVEASVARLDTIDTAYAAEVTRDAIDDVRSAVEELYALATTDCDEDDCECISSVDQDFAGRYRKAVDENLDLLDLLLGSSS